MIVVGYEHDGVRRAVEARHDVRNNTLATLIQSALQNDNRAPRNRRRQFDGQVSESVFDLIEGVAQEQDEDGEGAPPA